MEQFRPLPYMEQFRPLPYMEQFQGLLFVLVPVDPRRRRRLDHRPEPEREDRGERDLPDVLVLLWPLCARRYMS